MDAFEQRMQSMLEQSNRSHIARMERIDRRLDATAKLLKQGAQVLLQIEQSQRELVKSLQTIPRNGHKK
jgi:hypothetical protein